MKFRLHLHQLLLQHYPRHSKSLRIMVKQAAVVQPSIQRSWPLSRRLILNQHLNLDLPSDQPLQLSFVTLDNEEMPFQLGKLFIELAIEDRAVKPLIHTDAPAHLIYSCVAVHLVHKDASSKASGSRASSNSSNKSKATEKSTRTDRVMPKYTIRKGIGQLKTQSRAVEHFEHRREKDVTPRKGPPAPIDLKDNSLAKRLQAIQQRIQSKSRDKPIKSSNLEKAGKLQQIENINRELELLKKSEIRPCQEMAVQTDWFIGNSQQKEIQFALETGEVSCQEQPYSRKESASTLQSHDRAFELQVKLEEVTVQLEKERGQKEQIRKLLSKIQTKYQNVQVKREEQGGEEKRLIQENLLLRRQMESLFQVLQESICNTKAIEDLYHILEHETQT